MIAFSIIIPLYNKELSIVSTLQSVLSQDYPNFEVIVVDDGSTDRSLEVAKTVSDSRIKIISTENRGVSSARNTGIKNASNEFITFLDADDIWFPDSLSEFKLLIEDFPQASVFCTSHTLNIKDIPSRGKRYYVDNYYKSTAEFFARYSVALLLIGCVAARKDCFDTVGCFDENMTHGEDLDMWKRLAEGYKFAKSELVTMKYRLDAENRSDKTRTKANNLILVKRKSIKDKYCKLDYGRLYFFQIYLNTLNRTNWMQSIYLFSRYGDWIFRFFGLIVKYRFLKIG
ncbi:MAG: glycosyltransferase family 2 protein [Dysgonomonas sp.]